MEEAAKWTDKLFFYFNPAVSTTTIMLSQILEEDPFDLFQRLYAFAGQRLNLSMVSTDIGIAMEHALALNDLLEEFIRGELCGRESSGMYLAPLIDAMAFAGFKTMFYSYDGRENGKTRVPLGAATQAKAVYPILSRHVVLKRFSHDMSALYKGNLLRSPRELTGLDQKAYDVVFNLLTHSVYHVSEHTSDLLAACSGRYSLEELVESLAKARNLAIDDRAHSAIQETFNDLARKQVVALIGAQLHLERFGARVVHLRP
jgi:hypothetical protein